jgi:hypothetical protein
VPNQTDVRHQPVLARVLSYLGLEQCSLLCLPGWLAPAQVGGFFFVHRDDLKRMSKLWLKYTEDVRADKEVGVRRVHREE